MLAGMNKDLAVSLSQLAAYRRSLDELRASPYDREDFHPIFSRRCGPSKAACKLPKLEGLITLARRKGPG
jgi:hypothetical protein